MNQSNKQTNNVYILTHDTDYMLLVSVIETFIAIATAVYMHIHITLFIEDSSLVGGVQWRVKKNDCQSRLSMPVQRQCVIY